MLRSVCIFSHYYDLPSIPYYVLIYLKELTLYFDEIVLVTNHRTIDNYLSLPENVKIRLVQNEGYDLGMFYKGFAGLDNSRYHTIACINDSNIVFGSLKFLFDWARRTKPDFWGLIDADIKPSYSTHSNNYHIQSHFMVFNQKAIDLLTDYFHTIDIDSIVKIQDRKQLKQRVIHDWEIGLSQYLISKDVITKTYINHKEFTKKQNASVNVNSTLKLYKELIQSGIPMIKKKIITAIHPAVLFTSPNWKDLIHQYADKTIDQKKLINELIHIRNRHYLKRMWNK